jgi:hypothetical protein
MPLSQATLGAPVETETSTASLPQVDRLYLEPRCHVCRNDEVRNKVNDLLASGASYAMTLRALGNDNAAGVTTDSIRRHADRHFPIQNVARATYREILERRARENSVDFVEGVATAITPMALLETVMVRSYESLVDPATQVDVKTGITAACRLQEMIDSHTDQLDWVKAQAEMGRVVELVRAFVPTERWPELRAALRGEAPTQTPETQEVQGIAMVDIDDGYDEDSY